jgi:4-hydroxy-3-polyprenylbenzoate decarboxylase
MAYRDLRDFIGQLEKMGELKRVSVPVSPHLEMTAVCDRTLRAAGPALLFEHPTGHNIPVLGNLFGTTRRVALGMGVNDVSELRQFGHVLATLKEPEAPKGFKELMGMGSLVKTLWSMAPKELRSAPCQAGPAAGAACWPGDVAPLITWGLVITRGPPQARAAEPGHLPPAGDRPRQVIMRWLAHRGGALDFREFAAGQPGPALPDRRGAGRRPGHHPGRRDAGARQPVGIPVCRPAARQPHRGGDTAVGEGGLQLQVPASAEIVLEGHIPPAAPASKASSALGVKLAEERRLPARAGRPVSATTPATTTSRTGSRCSRSTASRTAARPDLPLHLHRQAARRARGAGRGAERGVRADPAEAVSGDHRLLPAARRLQLPHGGGSIKKAYPGHAKRVMFGLWSFLRQFMYTKFIVVTDDDVNIRDWKEVIWAITTRMDPVRDTTLVDTRPSTTWTSPRRSAAWAARWGWTPPTSGRERNQPRMGACC